MDTKGAGTNGDVFFKLVGPSGETDEVQLRNGDDDFKRGATDTFTVNGPDVGDSPTVQLRLVRGALSLLRLARPPSSGAPNHCCACLALASQAAPATKEGEEPIVVRSGWAVDRVEVLNKKSGIRGTHAYNSWLNMPAACASITQSSSVQVGQVTGGDEGSGSSLPLRTPTQRCGRCHADQRPRAPIARSCAGPEQVRRQGDDGHADRRRL